MEFVTVNPEIQEAFFPLLSGEIAQELAAQPDIMALGAIEDKRPAGILVFALEETQLRIIWLCTSEEMRGRGVARALVRLLARQALLDRQTDRLVADVSKSAPLDPAYLLFLSEGWIATPFQRNAYSCTLAQLAEQEFWQQNTEETGVSLLSELPHFMLKEYSALLYDKEDGVPIALPLQLEEYDSDISLGYVSGEKLLACVLFTSHADEIVLSYAHTLPDAKAGIARLFYSAGKRAMAKYPPETRFSFAAITPASRRLAEKLLPVCQPQPMYRMSLWLRSLTEGGNDL